MRVAEPADAQGWIDLLEAVASEGRFIAVERVGLKRRRLAAHFRKKAFDVAECSLVATDPNGEIVGQLSAVRDAGIFRHTAELGMSVAADLRRKGIGKGLVDAAEQWARWAGVEKLTLMVFPHNTGAIAFYSSLGFTEEGLRRRHAKMTYGYEDLTEMSLFLD